MTLTSNNSTEVIFNRIEKETEKAVMVNLPVNWNDNWHSRSLWFPKSCVKIYTNTMDIASFLIEKMGNENAFHGYRMNFERVNNAC